MSRAVVTRIRIPLGSTRGLAFGDVDGEPVILSGDRDLYRSIGEGLEERARPPDFSPPGEVMVAGEEAREMLRNWDSLPRMEAGVVVGYALGGRAARGEPAPGAPAPPEPEVGSPWLDITPENTAYSYMLRELLVEHDRLKREMAAVGAAPDSWLVGRAAGIWFAVERVGEQLGILEFDPEYILRALEGRVPEYRSPFIDDSAD
jgi:hypothetical protein